MRTMCAPSRPASSRSVMLLVGLLLASAPAAAGSLPPSVQDVPVATDAERAALRTGEIVVRVEDDGWTYAWVQVDATPDRILDAVLDFHARAGDVAAIKEVEVYLDQGDTRGVRWDLSMAGVKVRFHTLYQIDRAALRTTYVLDESRENDLGDTVGAYTVLSGEGQPSTLVYQARSDSKAPDWVRKLLTQRSSRAMLGGMKARAEAR